ncbi:MAG: type VI secretion system baseplate subunit TssE [Mariniblastus sp.]
MTPSILDRMIQTCYELEPTGFGYDEKDLIASVERDLESLLNSRQTRLGLENFPVLQNSIIGFGLPDAQGFDLETPQARYRLAQTIESVIEEFEPRVCDVHVEMQGETGQIQSLRMQITARLNVESETMIAFETTLKLATGRYEIKPNK